MDGKMSDAQNSAGCPDTCNTCAPVITTIDAQVRLRQNEAVNDFGFLTKISKEDFEGPEKKRIVLRMGIILVKGKVQKELTLKNTDKNNQLDTLLVIPFSRIEQNTQISDLADENDYLFRTILTDVPDANTDAVTIRPYIVYKDSKNVNCKIITHYGEQIPFNITIGK